MNCYSKTDSPNQIKLSMVPFESAASRDQLGTTHLAMWAVQDSQTSLSRTMDNIDPAGLRFKMSRDNSHSFLP